jgi:hypothetical protein
MNIYHVNFYGRARVLTLLNSRKQKSPSGRDDRHHVTPTPENNKSAPGGHGRGSVRSSDAGYERIMT